MYLSPKVYIGNDIQRFLIRVSKEYPDFIFIPQLVRELKEIYIGAPYGRDEKTLYPCDLDAPLFKDGRARSPLNVPAWLDLVSEKDFTVGPRIHGSIASTLAGTPALTIVKDIRMQELVSFHHLAYVTIDEVHADSELSDLIEGKDFHEFERYQGENFSHYLNFLHANGLETIYDKDIHAKEAPLDRKVKETDLYRPVVPFSAVSDKERNRRKKTYFLREEQKLQRYEDSIREKNKKISELDSRVSELEKQLEIYKSRGLYGDLRKLKYRLTHGRK